MQRLQAKGNGQFVKSGESGEADRAVGLETMAEIKASLAEGGRSFKITPSTVVQMIDACL